MIFEKWIKDWKSALAENFFLRSLCLLLVAALIINGSFFKKKERIVLTPPKLNHEAWIDPDKASPSYLQEMAIFLATMGGNLSPTNAQYSLKIISDYIPASKYTEMMPDLEAQIMYVKKNNITQAFFPESSKIIEEKNAVDVEGKVIRNIGTQKISEEKMTYHVAFAVDNYRLYLTEFYVDYPDKSKEKWKEIKEQNDMKKTIHETVKKGAEQNAK